MQSLAQSASLSEAWLTNTNLLLGRYGLMSAAVFEGAGLGKQPYTAESILLYVCKLHLLGGT